MAVFFDLDGTLCGVEEPRSKLLKKCLDICDLPDIDRDEYISAHDRVSCNRKISDREPIFIEVFRGKDIDDENAIEELASLYREKVLENLYLFEGAEKVLSSIKDRKVLVTNGPDQVQREKTEFLDIESYFDSIVTSGEIGFAKPDPKIINYAEDKSGCNPEIYVGNSLRHDVACAINYGIKSVIIERRERKKYFRSLKPTYRINRLESLREIPEIEFI